MSFLWAKTKHVTISNFPLQMPAKSTRLEHVTNEDASLAVKHAGPGCVLPVAYKQ